MKKSPPYNEDDRLAEPIVAVTVIEAAREKSCWQCGERFVCGAGDIGEACWCDSSPPAPITNAEADCLCPVCLEAAAAATHPIPSPCIKICSLAPGSGLCIGCHRTLDEIAAWSVFSDQERQAIFDALPGRKI